MSAHGDARDTFSIRDADSGDAESIAALVSGLGYPTTADAMRQRLATILADSTYCTLVAEQARTVVGVAGATINHYYERDGVYARIAALAVSPDSQRRGIGTALVQAVERWSLTHGAHEVFVNSGTQRREAHQFYERHGYAATGLRFVKALDHARIKGSDRAPTKKSRVTLRPPADRFRASSETR